MLIHIAYSQFQNRDNHDSLKKITTEETTMEVTDPTVPVAASLS
jgi:hypothetical protein